MIERTLRNNASDKRLELGSTVRKTALQSLKASAPQQNREQVATDIKILDEAARMFTSTGSCRTDGKSGWIIKGMKSALESYQMIGAAFMRYRETRSQNPKEDFLPMLWVLGYVSRLLFTT